MNVIRSTSILLAVFCVAGRTLTAYSGQVRFRGMVITSERHDVVPICYGDYFVDVAIAEVLADPNNTLLRLTSVEVCYGSAEGLVRGDYVEVNGYYWGHGSCPKQYCGRVQLIAKTDYITKIGFCCPDGDWMVADSNMHAIPSGNVGIGTSSPDSKLHVRGNVLVEGQGLSSFSAPLTVTHDGQGRQLAGYFSNRRDGDGEVEVQLAGGRMLPWGWSLRAASGLFTLGSIMVIPPALNITSTGYLGLGVTSPTYRLELPNIAGPAGRGRANSWTTYSSARWKTNIKTIDDAVAKVRQLRGVVFGWKEGGRHDIGLVAEEVAKVLPEVVDPDPTSGEPAAIDYGRLAALLIEAIKQQDARIRQLEQLIEQIQHNGHPIGIDNN